MFNKEQLDFINSDIINLKLLGIPGGGKTRCIIEHIHNNIKKENLVNSNEYLICTFSRKAKQDFLEKGRKYVDKIKFKDVKNRKFAFNINNVKTIHSISGVILKKRKKTTSSLNTCVLGGLKILEENKEDDIEKFAKIKIIYIDEAQDISDIQNSFINLLSKRINAKLCYIGDPNQNIYQFQNGSDRYLMDYNADKTVELVINYRSTPELISFYNEIKPHQMCKNMRTEKQGNYSKPIIYCNDYENIENDILNTILKTDYKYENIAILSPVKLSKFVEKSNKSKSKYYNLGLSLVRHLFIRNRIPFVQHYNDGNLKFDNEKINIKEGHINLLTIHGSKGLEFDLVLVLNYHHRTMSKVPSRKEYEEFRYLWYVAMTRAKYSLKIYTDINSEIFSDFQNIDNSKYELDCKGKIKITNNFNEVEILKCGVSITDFLNNLTPEEEYKLEEIIKYGVKMEKIFDNGKLLPYEYNYFGDCYGNFIESYFEYSYKIRFEKDEMVLSLVKKVCDIINNRIIIKENYLSGYYKLNRKFLDLGDGMTLRRLKNYLNEFENDEKSLYYYVQSIIGDDIDKVFYLILKDKLKLDDLNVVKKVIENLDSNPRLNIWKLCIFLKIENYESGYLWKIDHTKYIQSVSVVLDNIDKYVKNNDFKFQVEVNHPKLPFNGIVDIMNDDSIIDIKFTSQLQNKHIYQLVMYYNNKYPDWSKDIQLQIYNLYMGVIFTVNLSSINTWMLNRTICEIGDVKIMNPVFVYDLETTSLDTYNCKIIQRHFEEYDLGYIPSSGYVKTSEPLYHHITGLTTSFLKKNGDDYTKFKEEMECIMKYCYNPVFIAHNGNSFDHKIMIENYKLFPPFTKTDDSKQIIRVLCNTFDTKNYKLEQIHNNLFKEKMIAHDAKDDVRMVIKILKKIGYATNKK